MSGHIAVAIFTLFPLAVLGTGVVASLVWVRRLGEWRLVVLVGILLLMGQHQVLELLRVAGGNAPPRGVSEVIETGANVLSTGAVYYGLVYAGRQQSLADELEASEHRYRTLTENSPLPILVYRDGTIVFANPAAAALLGADRAVDIEGMALSSLVHPDSDDELQNHIDAMLDREGTIRTSQQRWVSVDGDPLHVVVSGGCADHEGEESVYLVVRDVTGEQEARADLEYAEARFETLFNSSNDAIFLIDPEKAEIREANARAEALLGYDRDSLTGLSAHAIHPHEETRFKDFLRAVRAEEQLVTDDLSCRTRDGQRVPVEVSASVVETGEEHLVLASARDVSERRRRENQIAVLRRILRHNLRNEMAIVGGLAETIARNSDDADITDAAERIESHADDLVETSESVRNLQKFVEAAGDPQAVDVTSLVLDATRAVQEAHSDATIEIETPDTAWATGTEALGLALEHLVENAVVHNDSDEPWVHVRVDRGESPSGYEQVVVRVADDGSGIPPGERVPLDLDADPTPTNHGSGFGLHTVGQVVDIAGGEVDIDEYNPTGGTVVTVTLPTPTYDNSPRAETRN
jgi:PAS domain S-box-containing protein